MSIVILSDVCKINMGQSPPSSSYNSVAEGLPFFQGNADFGDLHPTVRVWTTNPIKIAQTDDVLISVRAPIGALNISTEKCCIGRGLAALTPDNRKIETAFLFYYLRARQDFLNQQGSGAIFKAVTKTILGDLQINLPSLERQREIVRVLDKVEAVIDKHKRQLAKLDELARARFVEMFGDGSNYPYKWDVADLSSLFKEFCSGECLVGEQREILPGEYAVLKVSAVTRGEFQPRECKVLPQNTEIRKGVFPRKGDMLMSRANTRELLGATALVDRDYPNLILPDKIWRITCRYVETTIFLKYLLSSPLMRQEISSKATGTSGSMFNISMEKLKKMKVITPPLPLQRQFAEFVTHNERMKRKVRASLEATQKLLGSLMQEYFS